MIPLSSNHFEQPRPGFFALSIGKIIMKKCKLVYLGKFLTLEFHETTPTEIWYKGHKFIQTPCPPIMQDETDEHSVFYEDAGSTAWRLYGTSLMESWTYSCTEPCPSPKFMQNAVLGFRVFQMKWQGSTSKLFKSFLTFQNEYKVPPEKDGDSILGGFDNGTTLKFLYLMNSISNEIEIENFFWSLFRTYSSYLSSQIQKHTYLFPFIPLEVRKHWAAFCHSEGRGVPYSEFLARENILGKYQIGNKTPWGVCINSVTGTMVPLEAQNLLANKSGQGYQLLPIFYDL